MIVRNHSQTAFLILDEVLLLETGQTPWQREKKAHASSCLPWGGGHPKLVHVHRERARGCCTGNLKKLQRVWSLTNLLQSHGHAQIPGKSPRTFSRTMRMLPLPLLIAILHSELSSSSSVIQNCNNFHCFDKESACLISSRRYLMSLVAFWFS